MNVRGDYNATENELRQSRSRAKSKKLMLFIFMHFLSGGNEAGIGLRAASQFYGLSVGTLSKCIRHVSWPLRTVLSRNSHAEIQWPSVLERRELNGMIAGFPKTVCFVDEAKIPAWEPHGKEDQIAKYDGHHHMHCLASLVWTDIYAVIIRVDCTVLVSMHDRANFNDSGPYRDQALIFSPG